MRLAGPVWIVPTPALLWTLLLVGHGLSAGAPVPALLEETAHTAALVAGAGSLAAAFLRERPHGWPSAKSAQAAANSRLCWARSAGSSRRQAGSSFRKLNLT